MILPQQIQKGKWLHPPQVAPPSSSTWWNWKTQLASVTVWMIHVHACIDPKSSCCHSEAVFHHVIWDTVTLYTCIWIKRWRLSAACVRLDARIAFSAPILQLSCSMSGITSAAQLESTCTSKAEGVTAVICRISSTLRFHTPLQTGDFLNTGQRRMSAFGVSWQLKSLLQSCLFFYILLCAF